MEFLKYIDWKWLFLINGHHSSFWDFVMWWVSDRWIWVPFYLFLVFLIARNLGKKAVVHLIFFGAAMVSADQLSKWIKIIVQRNRPSHQPDIQNLLHYVNNYHGGTYGFVSSHATNVFTLSFFLLFSLGAKIKWLPFLLFPWAILISYSRIYLGVHYPSDVIGGFLISIPLAFSFYKMQEFVLENYFQKNINYK